LLGTKYAARCLAVVIFILNGVNIEGKPRLTLASQDPESETRRSEARMAVIRGLKFPEFPRNFRRRVPAFRASLRRVPLPGSRDAEVGLKRCTNDNLLTTF